MFEHVLKIYCHKCNEVFFGSSEQRIYTYLTFKVSCPFCIEDQIIPDDYRGRRHLLPVARLGIYECSRHLSQVNQNNTTPIEYSQR